MATSVDFLRSLGYTVEVIYTPLAADSTLKQSALTRAAEIHAAFVNPAVSAVICTVGGLTCNELVHYLDYELIKANPKIFCGYSDITVLHYALYEHADLRTFYGPTSLTQWSEYPTPLAFTTENFFRAVTSPEPLGALSASKEWTPESCAKHWLTGTEPTGPRPLEPNPGWRWLRPGRSTGMIFGGCLPVLLRFCGTEWDLQSYENVILVLELPEADDHKPAPLERSTSQLSDLANRGVFKAISGLVFGRSYGYTDEMNAKLERYLLEVTEGFQFPIVAGVDIGHTDPMLTIPFGANAEMDGEKGTLVISEGGVR